MKDRSVLRLMVALAISAASLTACVLPGNPDYINGTIDGSAHNKSGYTLSGVGSGATFLLAADSLLAYVAYDGIWQVNILGATAGSYVYPNVSVAYYVSTTGLYNSGSDITVEVTEYSVSEIAGTFAGTFTYNAAGSFPVAGEFRLHFK